jgi:SAM-dependent methyltransferase
VSSFTQRCANFQEWLTTPQGRHLLVQEKKWLNDQLRQIGGHQLLQVSATNHVFFKRSMAANKVVLHFSPLINLNTKTAILGEIDSWPIATESINILVLHHVLDFVENPHTFLREASRVLTPGGHVICCGFNPWSGLGFWRHFSLRLRSGNYIRPARLKDWFKLLGFDVKVEQYVMYKTGNQAFEKKAQRYNLPIGGAYLTTLRKSVQSITPVMSLWKKQKAPLIALSSFSRTQIKKPKDC